MSYLSTEASDEGGEPVELYRFDVYGGWWLYCTGETETAYNGDTYMPHTITRGSIESAQDAARNSLTITTPWDTPFVRAYMDRNSGGPVWLTIYRGHRGDDEFVTAWSGRVVLVTQAGATATIKAETFLSSIERTGLGPQYQLQCRRTLYETGCNVDSSLHRLEATIATVIGAQVVATAAATMPDGWFAGGKLMLSNGLQRMIYLHQGAALTLASPMAELTTGMTVSLYPGCAHTLDACGAKFGNTVNYGGMPWLPIKNPFAGDAIL